MVVRVVVLVLMSLRALVGAVLGVGLLAVAADDDTGWGGLIAFFGACCIAFAAVSSAQAIMVLSRRRWGLIATAVLEAGQLLLWLSVLAQTRGEPGTFVLLLIVASVGVLVFVGSEKMRWCGS